MLRMLSRPLKEFLAVGTNPAHAFCFWVLKFQKMWAHQAQVPDAKGWRLGPPKTILSLPRYSSEIAMLQLILQAVHANFFKVVPAVALSVSTALHFYLDQAKPVLP